MPIYEYTCHGCGHDVEIWQKISEKPKKACPDCGARKLERVISATSFHLKGSGWYVTDYANKGSSGSPNSPSHSSSKAKSLEKTSETSDSSSKTETSKAETSKASSD